LFCIELTSSFQFDSPKKSYTQGFEFDKLTHQKIRSEFDSFKTKMLLFVTVENPYLCN